MLRVQATIILLSLATVFASPAARGAETNVLQTLRPMIAQVTKEFDQIPADRQKELRKLALYVKSQLAANETPQLTFICTHNSRRSHLAPTWAQTAAAYYDVPGIKTYSGGIQVTACNIRTVWTHATRRLLGGRKQWRDESGLPNTVFRFRRTIARLFQIVQSRWQPTNHYAAIMTCDNADKNCPVVEGSSLRVGVHYVDPKDSDGKPEEEATYDERCHQIAREMFYFMSLVKS